MKKKRIKQRHLYSTEGTINTSDANKKRRNTPV